MKNVSQFVSKENIEVEASLWVSRLDRGLNKDETLHLQQWVAKSEENYKQLLKMAAYWDNLTVLNELSALFPLEKVKKSHFNKIKIFALVACFALFSLMTTVLLTTEKSIPTFFQFGHSHNQSLMTHIGQQNTFTLIDGSIVVLNTDSKLEIEFTSTHRKLNLLKGEANFDVAKDASRPFTVQVGSSAFTALGTVFNVQKNNENTMELVVTEGRVLISNSEDTLEQLTQAIDIESPLIDDSFIVNTGQKAVVDSTTLTPVVELPLEEIQRDLSWQQGILIFEGESLSHALTEVSRYTDTVFEIASPSIADLKVAGYFKAGDVDALLASLSANLDVVATYTSTKHVILSSGKNNS